MRGFIAKLQNPHVHLCSEDRLVVTAEVRGVRLERGRGHGQKPSFPAESAFC